VRLIAVRAVVDVGGLRDMVVRGCTSLQRRKI
jgi:hypothetical protein